jgi:TPR repeat protein
MIKFIYLIAIICTPVQALQILQPDGNNEIVNHQALSLDETSEMSNELLLTKLEKSAKSGDARSQFSLANMYHNGIGIRADEKLAFYWYTQVAEQGFASAQFNIANGYYHGIGTTKNLTKAQAWYKKSAEQDFITAQYNLAVMYRLGEGSEVNNEEAFRWYRRAAKLGYGMAQLTLAKLYETGVGTTQSDVQAQVWYLKAAKQLNPEAQFYLAEFYKQRNDYVQAVFYYRQASEQDYVLAQYALAMSLLEGTGVIKDEDSAQQLLLKIAKTGYANAQFQLGKLLLNKKQLLKAKVWLSKASEQSIEEATILLTGLNTFEQLSKNILALLADLENLEQLNEDTEALTLAKISPLIVKLDEDKKLITKILATKKPTTEKLAIEAPTKKPELIITGTILNVLPTQEPLNVPILIPSQQPISNTITSKSTTINNVEKLMASAKQGNPIAQYNLSILYSIGKLVARDDIKAFLLMQQSARQDNTQAQNSLAMMYFSGVGVESNYQKAYYWASTSARKNNTKGRQILLYLVGSSL